MYGERVDLYKEIEEKRNSKLLLYVTGDRPGLETQIHSEVLNLFVDHLDAIGSVPKISLFLYTQGATAEFENGVLTLTFPKAEHVKPKTIQVKAK